MIPENIVINFMNFKTSLQITQTSYKILKDFEIVETFT